MTELLNKLYRFSPIWAQNLGISLYGWHWQKRRFGGVFEQELKAFRERENYDPIQWRDYQTTQLRMLLIHAFETVPFYNEKYKNSGFNVSQFKRFELEDLQRLPFLEKDDLRQFGKTSLLSGKLDKNGAFYSSSGSTGTPTNIYLSKKTHQKWTAGYEARVKNWAGVSKQMVRGMIGGRRILPYSETRPPYYRYNFFERMVYFSAFHISAQTTPNYIEGIRKHNVDFMMGYAMSNYILARFINEGGVKAPQLRAVITSSEKLTMEMREEFRKAYGCESFDTWSGVEACAQISECEHHSLHESPDIGIIELIDEKGMPQTEGKSGEAVCTSLINYDQPLIRYRCGDLLRPLDLTCSCGRSMRKYDEIIGRIEDVVIGSDGREMVRFHGIFINLPSVIEGQVIQHSLYDFEIKVVCSGQLKEEERVEINRRMESQLGEIRLDIHQVHEIEKGPNGKFKAVISKVNRN